MTRPCPGDCGARPRSTTGAALLTNFATGRGMALADILRDTGIREEQLRDPSAEVTLDQELALTRNVVGEVGDEPGLGLMAGLLCHPPSLGVLGFAVMSSSTLRHALEIAVRHADLLFTCAHFNLHDHGDEIWLLRDDHNVPRALKRFVLERDIAALTTIQQDLIQIKVPTARVEVALEPHPVYEMFAALFGAERVVFSAPETVLGWPSTALENPLPLANPATVRYYEQQCADLVQRRRDRGGVSGQVRELLIRCGRITDQGRIAAELGLSVRTLRRRLADEGTTFRELNLETVGVLAEELLMAGLTVEQVADRLGYSSVSAFTAAFRSWKGQSPGQFARANRGRVAVRV
ncbi:AraC family transcriptional regulator [Nocardia sp. CDC159]|uniref:AraC family transcriptional regulator n=1 Tax=Nocardia pulmonis TaxID=2951408 RepID=A0A9X2J0Y7_9NOCA|nr:MULTISPECIES: AraC family transcriptional regulator [Nocardia]MCM6776426.1 AraC family transcriptional regulator [Nocardia pulmonis]MCM6788850.1 AraC family transcriptional regulator [Nocardia sp. CDC159]